MSKYTTELRFICETLNGDEESSGYNDIEEIIDNVWDKIFSFDFPIFSETYRENLCKKIIKHYYTREIGLETYGLWKLKLDAKLNEIMPYYNKLYESELLVYNPLETSNYTKMHSGQNTSSLSGTDGGSNTSSNSTLSAYSDTPQGTLTNLENNSYLTNASKGSASGSSTSTLTTSRSGSGTDVYTETITGYTGVIPSELIEKYRKILLNIDMLVINELEELFMQLW